MAPVMVRDGLRLFTRCDHGGFVLAGDYAAHTWRWAVAIYHEGPWAWMACKSGRHRYFCWCRWTLAVTRSARP